MNLDETFLRFSGITGNFIWKLQAFNDSLPSRSGKCNELWMNNYEWIIVNELWMNNYELINFSSDEPDCHHGLCKKKK